MTPLEVPPAGAPLTQGDVIAECPVYLFPADGAVDSSRPPSVFRE